MGVIRGIEFTAKQEGDPRPQQVIDDAARATVLAAHPPAFLHLHAALVVVPQAAAFNRKNTLLKFVD